MPTSLSYSILNKLIVLKIVCCETHYLRIFSLIGKTSSEDVGSNPTISTNVWLEVYLIVVIEISEAVYCEIRSFKMSNRSNLLLKLVVMLI